MDIAKRNNLLVIEDAAQGIQAEYKGRPLGSIGHLAALSFHETKNIISGEGGALLINSPEMIERAEIIREKGTNRSQFFRGQVDKYTWVDIGSSYLPSELIAAFLWAQMEAAQSITERRLHIWGTYHLGLEQLEIDGKLRRPIIPQHCSQNAHMYYLLLPDLGTRDQLISKLAEAKIHAVFHYVPLHSSIYGVKHRGSNTPLPFTEDLSERLIRIPLWLGIENVQRHVIDFIVGAA